MNRGVLIPGPVLQSPGCLSSLSSHLGALPSPEARANNKRPVSPGFWKLLWLLPGPFKWPLEGAAWLKPATSLQTPTWVTTRSCNLPGIPSSPEFPLLPCGWSSAAWRAGASLPKVLQVPVSTDLIQLLCCGCPSPLANWNLTPSWEKQGVIRWAETGAVCSGRYQES